MDTTRVWVITGVNIGLGLALATHVASRGDQVVGTVRSLSKFPDALKTLGVSPLVLDLSGTDDEIKAVSEAALQIHGRVDVLVNSAGMGLLGPVEELKMSDIRAQFQTNVLGLVAFTQPFVSQFRTRRTGHILNVSSVGSICTAGGWGAYSASKAALDAFTDALHFELKLFGVRVLSIVPGYFASNFMGRIPSHALSKDAPAKHDGLSKVYTDPETQGYDTANIFSKMHVDQGQIGDPEKWAARVWEVVVGEGAAAECGLLARVQGHDADGKPMWEGPWEMNRVPLGRDCGVLVEGRLSHLQENWKAWRTVAQSTDMDAEKLKYYPRG